MVTLFQATNHILDISEHVIHHPGNQVNVVCAHRGLHNRDRGVRKWEQIIRTLSDAAECWANEQLCLADGFSQQTTCRL